MKSKYDEQVAALEKTIETLKKEQQMMSEGISSENPYLQTFLSYGAMKELDRSAVVDLVDTVFVHEGGEVEIKFNFRDQHKLIMDFIESNTAEEKQCVGA